MSVKVRIKTEDLPVRARGLSPDELSKVFGGCLNTGWVCAYPSDCCNRKCGGGLNLGELPGDGHMDLIVFKTCQA